MTKAIKLNNNGIGYLGEMATLETFNNNFNKATSVYDKAIKQSPEDYISLTGAGLMELKKGNTDTSINYFLKASLLEPKYAQAHIYLAIAYYQQNRTKHALQELKISSELDKNNPLPYFISAQIHNDQYQPAAAISAGREAMLRLPYLKSLNQLANNQKGSANLGNALAGFGMKEWAMSYAQESYYPYWAGSHLFLAESYQGDFKKNSKLFQGFLSDPTVFGASNKNESLVLSPGNYFEATTIAQYQKTTREVDYRSKMLMPRIKMNGYTNDSFPISYFVETDQQFVRSESSDPTSYNDFDNGQYIIALGGKLTEKQNYFLYANHANLKLEIDLPSYATVTENDYGATKITLISEPQLNSKSTKEDSRIDAGYQYKFNPKSQFWIKVGYTDNTKIDKSDNLFNSTSTVSTQISENISNQNITQTNTHSILNANEDTKQQDIQLRQIFTLNNQHEVSLGLDLSNSKVDRLTKNKSIINNTSTFIMTQFGQTSEFPSPTTQTISNFQYTQQQENEYSSIYLEDKYSYNKQFLLHYALHYSKFADSYKYISEFSQDMSNDSFKKLQPRFGLRYKSTNNWIFRGAYQKWIKPSSDYLA